MYSLVLGMRKRATKMHIECDFHSPQIAQNHILGAFVWISRSRFASVFLCTIFVRLSMYHFFVSFYPNAFNTVD
jgi:hypothetical protein